MEKLKDYTVYLEGEKDGISVKAKNTADAKSIAENPMNWKDGKKRTAVWIEEWN